MELTKNVDSLVGQITNLLCLDRIIETILVDDSVGSIEVSKTVKEVDSIRHITQNIDYKLKCTRLLIKSNEKLNLNLIISDLDDETITQNSSLCECIAKNTNNIFSKEFAKFKSTIKNEINFNNQGFFKKMFNKMKVSDILKKIEEISSNCSWVVIPKHLVYIFEDRNNFIPNESQQKRVIHYLGIYKNITVYVNPDQKESTMYFGSYDALTLIINKNLQVSDMKTLSETYTETKSMCVDYLFLENKPLVSLTIL
jgi:hypothetical protein